MSRTEQNRFAKQRSRAKAAEAGLITITITLTPEQALTYCQCRQAQKGPKEGFAVRALMVGAKFAANAGQPRGRKPADKSAGCEKVRLA